MSASQQHFARLSQYIVGIPVWYSSAGWMLSIAAIAGIIVFEVRSVLGEVGIGVLLIGVPTVVTGMLTVAVDRRINGQLPVDASFLLALLGELLMAAVLLVVGFTVSVMGYDHSFVVDALFAGLGFVFALRLLILFMVSHGSLTLAAISASVQTVSTALFLFVGRIVLHLDAGFGFRSDYGLYLRTAAEVGATIANNAILLGVTAVLYTVTVYVILVVVTWPVKQQLGVSAFEFTRGFSGHLIEKSTELEDFFEKLGERVIVPVTVLSFRRPAGTEKARFVLPMVHPGPVGEIGGGTIPQRIAEAVDGVAFPAHATADYDFNPVSQADVDSLVRAADQAYEQIEYTTVATPSLRESSGDATVLGQVFGNGALLVTTFSPHNADDVAYGTGLPAMIEARIGDIDTALLVDAHNCNDTGSEHAGEVSPGSERAFDIKHAVTQLAPQLVESEREPLAVGVAWDPTEWTPEEGVGPLGTRVAVTAVGDRTTAYVLFDGNNMISGLREQLCSEIDTVDTMEVMTTDTHVVNRATATNQIGEAIDPDELLALVSRLVDDALDDLEPVEAGTATEYAEVTVFGSGRTETFSSHGTLITSLGTTFIVVVVTAVVAMTVMITWML
jgi:putative membrane protein